MLVEATPAEVAAEPSPTRQQVVRELALDLQQALSRRGRAPFVLAGLPMFEDLCALQQTLADCLALGDDPSLRRWHQLLSERLPAYRQEFAEVQQALEWVEEIKAFLETPLPTETEPGPGGDAVARQLAHYLGPLADLSDLSPWLSTFRDKELLARSERYWAGLFPCYDIVGLPRPNNEHESLYGQLKRGLRRPRGVQELREPLRRHGAWLLFQNNPPPALREVLGGPPEGGTLVGKPRWGLLVTLCQSSFGCCHDLLARGYTA